jgi:aminoglycoside phosphotransferase (APT) family kinase protein
VLDDSLREGEIREALARSWPPAAPDEHRLLHGDFWPGNVLWHDATVAAVIDWEEAVSGDRLADVGITRLDLLWVYGPAASAAFTDRYAAVSGIDMDDLPVWDLVAALRPTGYLSLWATGWPGLGRPDITSATMRDGHNQFVTAALASLARV